MANRGERPAHLRLVASGEAGGPANVERERERLLVTRFENAERARMSAKHQLLSAIHEYYGTRERIPKDVLDKMARLTSDLDVPFLRVRSELLRTMGVSPVRED